MAILNMIAQGNWWWWGGNIWEPLNLTVTVSWTDATIKWEDNEIWTIPPTAFAKSVLVRKVGSAPATPSDWTVVVTETVKDTYKTNWYVDSWLTGWTTYYYRVFSYADLWGISYCDAVSVTPSQWWQPWPNTVAYYPLTSVSTVNDMSWNSHTLTNSNVTFGVNQWVDCAVSSGSNYLYANITSIPLWSSARTMSVWVYINSMTNSAEYNTIGYGTNGAHESFQLYQSGYNNISLRLYYDDALASWNSDWYQNWINIMATYDGSTARLYVNWEQKATSNVSLSTSWSTFYIWKHFVPNGTNWYISEVIIEDKCWTAQDISNYYDQTKWDYWY